MKSSIKIALLFILLITLTSCQNENKENNLPLAGAESYLSITCAREDEDAHTESGIIIENYCYDLASGKIDMVEVSVDYTSQYPLFVYDKRKNVAYYSEQTMNDGIYGDQLFSLDLNTNETRQLTDNLFAINYIIPADERVYLAAVTKSQREIHAMYYSLTDDILVESNLDSGLFFDLLTYDPASKSLFGAAYFWTDSLAAMENSIDGKSIPPNYYIYDFTNDFINPELIFKTDHQLIHRFCYDENHGLFFTLADSQPYWEPEFLSQFLDVKDKTLKPAMNLDSMIYLNRSIYMYEGSFYFIGVNEQDIRGIYKYNIVSDIFELVFSPDEGFINGFVMLQ